MSEIVGWDPATGEDPSRSLGVKGDPVNIGDVGLVTHDDTDLLKGWDIDPSKSSSAKRKMSVVGHGQVPFKEGEQPLAAVSFKRISQWATLSFPQLRRIRLGNGFSAAQNAAARAVVAAVGLHAHHGAFGRPFTLRSGTTLAPAQTGMRLDADLFTPGGRSRPPRPHC